MVRLCRRDGHGMIGTYLKMVPGYPLSPAYVAHETGQIQSDTITISKPTGAEAGCSLIVFLSAQAPGTTFTLPVGWTEVAEDESCVVGWKTAGYSEGANYSFTLNRSTRVSGIIVAYRGCNVADPIVAQSVFVYGSGTIIVPGITAKNGNYLLTFVANDNNNISYSPPTGMQEVASDSDGTETSWALFYKAVNAGATGDISITGTGQAINIAIGPVS